jgi:hypothetical protein
LSGGALHDTEHNDPNTAMIINRDFNIVSSRQMAAAMMATSVRPRLYTCCAHRFRNDDLAFLQSLRAM